MAASEPRGPVFDVEQVGRLMELMEQHAVNVVEMRSGDRRIRLRRGFPPAAVAMTAAAPVSQVVAAPAVAPSQSAASATPAPEEGAHIVAIKSPMVGTFYLRPKPDSQAFVKVGDRVGPETTVCIIEAMKTFNEIPARVGGVVIAVLAKNEEPVDYDRPLFKVDTSK